MKDYILYELEKIRHSKERTVAQLNALSGAEEAFINMLSEIERKEKGEMSENEQD